MRDAYPLAVSLRVIGEPTETFLRRHLLDLIPRRTIAVGEMRRDPAWEPPPPIIGPGPSGEYEGAVEELLAAGVRVVLGEYLDESVPWLERLKGSGITLFGHAHGYDVSERLRDPACRMAYRGYGEAGGVVTMSMHSKRRLIDSGLPADKVHVVYYGTDVPERITYRPLVDEVAILAVGRMVQKKGPLLTLEAFRQAALRRPSMTLGMVGAGPLLAAARRFVDETGLAQRVTFHGELPNPHVRALMQRADVFAQHSVTAEPSGDEEGVPVALLEAMAEGLPVVATRHAGIPEAVEANVTGWLVPEGDVAAMAEALVELADDRALRLRFGQAGWDMARQRFTWNRERVELLSHIGLGEFQ